MSDEVQATAIDADETEWKSVRRGMHIVPIGLVFESSENARYLFDSKKIDDLAEMIKSCGGINNDAGKARRNETLGEFDGFELLDGARRYRALQKLGATHMKLEIVEVFDGKATRQVAMMTRLGKVDLNPMELCREYHRMMDAVDYASVKELAAQTGQSGHERTIHDIMSLDKLQPDVAEELELGDLTLAHAVLIAREKPDDQIKLLGMCYETETVTIGALPETHKRLISAKALAGIIQSQFREAPGEKKADLLDSAKEESKQREKATSLETSGTKLLDGAGGDDQDGPTHDDDEDDPNADLPTDDDAISGDPETAEQYEPTQDEVKSTTGLIRFLDENFKEEWPKGLFWANFTTSLLADLLTLRIERREMIRELSKPNVIAEKKAEKKVKVKKLSDEELELLGEESVRTVFQNCDMEDIREVGASDDELQQWICKQIGESEQWNSFPAGGYCGRVRSFLNVPIVCVYRNNAEADEALAPLIEVKNEELIQKVRVLFGIDERKAAAVKKPSKKKPAKSKAKAAKKRAK